MTSAQTDILIIFSANLRRVRKERGFSQRELSTRCNIDNADISRMEKGSINVTLKTMEQLALALEVTVIELLQEMG